MIKLTEDQIKTSITCGAIGDYIGVNCEFISRLELYHKSLDEIINQYNQYEIPFGTWSDDTSLTLCTMESIAEEGYNPIDMSKRFVRWLEEGYMTATGKVFDVGGTTLWAIKKLSSGMLWVFSSSASPNIVVPPGDAIAGER